MAEEPHSLSTPSAVHTGAPASEEDAVLALRNGPMGAYLIAGIAVGLLFLGWLAFYFLLFMPRGPVG